MNTVTATSAFALMLLAPMGHARALAPQAAGVMVAGLLMSNLYPGGLMAKYGMTRSQLVVSDILLHIMPFVIVSLYPPPQEDLKILSLLLPIVLGAVSVGTDPRHAYPGVPMWVYAVYVMMVLYMFSQPDP
jgi:hypothetical protein